MLFKAMVKLKFEQNVDSNRNGTHKINSISQTPTKIKVSFYFYQVSDVLDRKFKVRLCTYISEKKFGCSYWSRCAK